MGSDATNELSYLMLEVTGNMKLAKLTVSARIHKRTPEEFLIKCCEINKIHGGGQPAIFNDETIIASKLAYEPGVTKEDAYDWSIIGCSEAGFAGKGTIGIVAPAMSGGKLLELMLYGKDPATGIQLSPGNGDITHDMTQWNSYNDMISAFSKQVRYYTRAIVTQTQPTQVAHRMYLPVPYLSSLTRDCVKRGRNLYDGGAIYGSEALLICYVGIANIGNSLAAIKKLVFDDKVITMEQLKHALETNFEDTTTDPTGPEIQQLCLRAPKYGNDDDYVDKITKECVNIMVKVLHEYKASGRGDWRATIAPVTAHVSFGLLCGATPDGRKAGTPLADAVSPTQGTDVKGPTAAAMSVAKLEHINITLGTIYNVKLHPVTVQEKAGLVKWSSLIRAYFDCGGWEMQFNTVLVETLRDAQKHPEKHRDLLVRVVGYSAFFIDLDKEIQDDIIRRTEHML